MPTSTEARGQGGGGDGFDGMEGHGGSVAGESGGLEAGNKGADMGVVVGEDGGERKEGEGDRGAEAPRVVESEVEAGAIVLMEVIHSPKVNRIVT